jgi:hypothetical protein
MNAFGLVMLPLMGFVALMAALDGYGIPAAAILAGFTLAAVSKASQ